MHFSGIYLNNFISSLFNHRFLCGRHITKLSSKQERIIRKLIDLRTVVIDKILHEEIPDLNAYEILSRELPLVMIDEDLDKLDERISSLLLYFSI